MKLINETIEKLAATNSLTEKKQILATVKGNSDFQKVCYYTYNTLITYGITLKALQKWNQSISFDGTMFDLLDQLASRKLSGHSALSAAHYFINTNEDGKLFSLVLDHDLGIRLSETVLNKEIFNSPEDEWYIPTFDVALAQTYSKASGKNVADFTVKKWVTTTKLDGLRCVTIVRDCVASVFARSGNEFLTLSRVTTAIEKLCKENNLDNVVFDGEICIVDENGKEDFQSIVSEAKKKDHTVQNPMYIMFDMVTLKEFEKQEGNIEYVDRLEALNSLVDNSERSNYFKVVKTWGIANSHEEIAELLAKVETEGAEGLMIRTGPYEGKRTWNLQKIKSFYDAEYTVNSIESEEIEFITYRDENGKEYFNRDDAAKGVKLTAVKTSSMMVARVNITHKGNNVGVGSGFSIRQRIDFHNEPSLIIGKEILVKYFEETTNAKGTISLRFPTVAHIYENGRKGI